MRKGLWEGRGPGTVTEEQAAKLGLEKGQAIDRQKEKDKQAQRPCFQRASQCPKHRQPDALGQRLSLSGTGAWDPSLQRALGCLSGCGGLIPNALRGRQDQEHDDSDRKGWPGRLPEGCQKAAGWATRETGRTREQGCGAGSNRKPAVQT